MLSSVMSGSINFLIFQNPWPYAPSNILHQDGGGGGGRGGGRQL